MSDMIVCKSCGKIFLKKYGYECPHCEYEARGDRDKDK